MQKISSSENTLWIFPKGRKGKGLEMGSLKRNITQMSFNFGNFSIKNKVGVV